MIDLHSHILPGIDDGSKSLEMSLQMARIAVADGTRVIACTPHIQPGVYDTTAQTIDTGIAQLASALDAAGIVLQLVRGADIHVVPDLPAKLLDGRVPVLGASHYFLFEPPHHVVPPGLDRLVSAALAAGFVPVLTHPERLTWIETNYELICRLDEMGAAVQLTAASITGGFGERAQYWSERMLDEGRVDIIASDAHHPQRRPPGLSRARDKVSARLGQTAGEQMTFANPLAILEDRPLPAKQRRKAKPRPGDKQGGILGFFRR